MLESRSTACLNTSLLSVSILSTCGPLQVVLGCDQRLTKSLGRSSYKQPAADEEPSDWAVIAGAVQVTTQSVNRDLETVKVQPKVQVPA